MITSHENDFDMSKGDTCLKGGAVIMDMEDSAPRFALHFCDIFSDAIQEGLIKDAFGVVKVFDNVSGDAGSAEAGME